MNLNDLSPAERAQLLRDLEEQQAKDRAAKEESKVTYKNMVDEFCELFLPRLLDHEKRQQELFDDIVDDCKELIDLKKDVYDLKKEQDSYTWTHRGGLGSFKIGWNVIIGFDGTESAGIEKVHDYLETLASDDENRIIIKELLNVLLKSDKEGKLNPTRIVELSNFAAKKNSKLLTEGVQIIVDGQTRKRTSMYVRGWAMDGEEKKHFSFTV